MTIAQAFCLNRKVRVNAAFGVWNSKLSFHCCSPRCGLQIFPRLSKGGTPHFVSRVQRLEVHDPDCSHLVERSRAGRASSDNSGGKQSLRLPGRPVPDNMMEGPGGRSELVTRKYSRGEIAELAVRAPMMNFPGDIEECTCAYRSMDDEQRDRQPLLIDGRFGTYGSHYGTRSQAQAALRGGGSAPSIVFFQGRAEPDREYGAISIMTEAEPFPISLHVPAAYVVTKRYLGEIWSDLHHAGPEMVTVYWRGPGPDENGDLVLPKSNGEHTFAIRLHCSPNLD